jgi:hypothetical protein
VSATEINWENISRLNHEERMANACRERSKLSEQIREHGFDPESILHAFHCAQMRQHQVGYPGNAVTNRWTKFFERGMTK